MTYAVYWYLNYFILFNTLHNFNIKNKYLTWHSEKLQKNHNMEVK